MIEQWKTLEELGFHLTTNIDAYQIYEKQNSEYTLRVYKIILWKDKRTYEYEDYSCRSEGGWDYDNSHTEPINRELHKGIELKMVEIGLWE